MQLNINLSICQYISYIFQHIIQIRIIIWIYIYIYKRKGLQI